MFRAVAAIGALAFFLGCGKTASAPSTAESPTDVAEARDKSVAPALSDVDQALKTGAYDDAAARLLELQSSGRSFTTREAADYRRSLNDAYSRALEAAEKGDKRAEAALQMIRASGAH